MVVKNTEFGFWDKLKYLFSNPSLFFEKIKLERGIKNSILMYVIVGFFCTSVSTLFLLGLAFISTGSISLSDITFISFSLPFIFWVIGIIFTFLYAGLVHAIITAFKGKGNYSTTYNICTYSMVPYLILSIIISILPFVFSIILMITGLSKLHDISKGKAVLACLFPLALAFIFLAIIAIFFLRLAF